MASILEKLEVKPVPKTKKGIMVSILREGQVAIKTTVINRQKENANFDREKIMKQLRERKLSVPKMSRKQKIKILTEALVEVDDIGDSTKDDTSRRNASTIDGTVDGTVDGFVKEIQKVKPKIKIKKIGRLKISKKIKKGTITQITDRSQLKSKAKEVIDGKIDVLRSQLPPNVIRFKKKLRKKMPSEEAPINIRAPSYYRNNREIFVNFINSLFAPYKDELIEESSTITCKSIKEKKSGKFSLLTHQKIVKDYINLFTPYRGLLIYHGLGAGKTCASIAIAEGFQSPTNVVIMTPASLRRNYINELKVCGNALYRLNQHWEFVSNDDNDNKTSVLADLLSIPERYVKKYSGAWFVNMNKSPNYEELDTNEKIILNEQIDEMIRAKYQFISYNGLRKTHLDDLTQNGTINPFSNKVIIIDEAHNFVSRIVNKITKPNSLSMKLYEYLMSAEQCRIVFLTGTPIINYPNEIGILFNILRGYIRTFRFNISIRGRGKVDQGTIEKIIGNFNIQDYVEYRPSSKQIVITRNPFGFVNRKNPSNLYEGVRLDRQGNMPTRKFISIITSRLEENNIDVLKVSEDPPYKALPDTLDGFKNMFINPKDSSVKNVNLFKRRILGLTSYFRSAQEELMPRFNLEEDLLIQLIPMSDYQFGIYETARSEERKLESRGAKRKKKGDGTYEDSISTYRIFSRAFCNFVFPPEITRPKPREGDNISTIIGRNVDEDILDIVTLQEKIANVDGRHGQDDLEELEKQQQQNVDTTYEDRIQTAIDDLKTNERKYLSPEGLAIYSPKFLTMYNNIQENSGLHLIYSQFRTLEGIGVFTMVLDANGYARFNLEKNATTGQWEIIENPEDEMKPKYALYTGTETDEVKEYMRLIFNGDWEKLPDSIKETLNSKGANNNRGEIIKVFMITSSGAEGISLKNTRYVHIMEPYWHPVRMEQVIGRARRICSHENLPEEERDVKVFLYLMRFTEKQLVPSVASGGMASKALLEKDVSKLDKSTPLTSDQALYEISNIKEDINRQLLRAVKESAFDCALHARSGDKDPLICMSFGNPAPSQFTTTPALTIEQDFDKEQKRNLEKIKWRALELTISGKRYAFKPSKPKSKTGDVYDLESYNRAVRLGGQPILVGRLIINRKKRKLEFEKI